MNVKPKAQETEPSGQVLAQRENISRHSMKRQNGSLSDMKSTKYMF